MSTILSPITNSPNVTLKDTIKTKDIINKYMQLYQIDTSHYFGDLETIDIYRCNDSDYYFYYPIIVGDSKFYEQLQNFEWYYKTEKWEYNKAKDLIADNSNILELGSGNGYFIDQMNSKQVNFESIELNESAKKILNKKGVKVYSDDILNFSNQNANLKYDVICAFQLLEHIPQLHDYFATFSKHLHKNGKLIIGVPNNESTLCDYHTNILNVTPHHAGLWSELLFQNIPKIFPEYKLIDVYFEPITLMTRYLAAKKLAKANYSKSSLLAKINYPLYFIKTFGMKKREISVHILGVFSRV